VKKEFNIQHQLDHKNILKAHELLTNDLNSVAHIIMDHFPCSKTLEELIQEKTRLDGNFRIFGIKEIEATLKIITLQVIDALSYMHGRGVCHRDLTASNILVNDSMESG